MIATYKFDNFIKKHRVICPECEGLKVMLYYNEAEMMNEEKPCNTCEGEGIVFKITRVEYKKLKDAK